MIYVNITGGLGNQMFQYAFAKRVQYETGQKICLNVYELEKYDKKRTLDLNNYNLIDNCSISHIELPWYVHRRNIFCKALRKFSANAFFEFGILHNSYIWYKECNVKMHELNKFKDIYIGGYWQSPIYSQPVLEDLRKDFELKQEINEEINCLVKDIKKKNSVCVHVRRGDYVGTQYDICSRNYYIKSMKYIEENVPDAFFYFFSDDIDWVKNNIPIDYKCHIIEKNNPSYIDLYLMSNCKHFIISNSTFSWWAQYLGTNNNKIVCAPSIWHKRNNYNDLYIPNWVLINCE